MKKLEIYDPALCCSTGVCGPAPDSELTAFASAINSIKNIVSVNRYNLAQQPGAFASNLTVKQLLQDEGPNALPLIFIDGKLVIKGIYPTGNQLNRLLDLGSSGDCCSGEESDCCDTEQKKANSDCCSGSSCC